MICILSPKITVEDIQYPEMREVLNNITYLRWPPKPSLNVPISAVSKTFRDFWDKLYTDIVKRDNKRYPDVRIVRSSVPV